MLKHTIFLLTTLALLNSSHAQDYKINKHVANNSSEQTITIDGQYWSDPFWHGTIPVPRVSASGNIVLPTTDNTFDFAATYDDSYLYVAVSVNESYVYNQTLGWLYTDSDVSTPWEDDAVEIYIDPKNGYPLFQAIINPKGINVPATLWTNSNYSKNGILFASAFYTGTKYVHQYVVELAIPWSKFGITPASGLSFGFDIAVDDDDNGGGRDGAIAWKGNANNWNSSANYGKVKLNAADYGVGYVNYYTGSPVVDGEVQQDPAYNTSTVANVTRRAIAVSDNEVNFRLTWDGTYLYVGLVVWDNHAYTNTLYGDSPDIWNDDAVEIFLDPGNTKLAYFNQALHRQILVKHTPFGTNPTVSIKGNSSGILAATKLLYTPIYIGGYSVEVAIPWSNLGISPATGTYLGVDIAVDDDDNGGNRDSQLAWKGTADNWQNASLWGTILLNYTGFGGSSAARISEEFTPTSVSSGTTIGHPNPVTDQLNVHFGHPVTQLKIMTAQGLVLHEENVEGKEMHTVSTSGLTSGIYFVTVTDEYGHVETLKIVK